MNWSDIVPDARVKPDDELADWNYRVPEFVVPREPSKKPQGPWKTTKQAAFAMLRQTPKLYNYISNVRDSSVFGQNVQGGKKKKNRTKKRNSKGQFIRRKSRSRKRSRSKSRSRGRSRSKSRGVQ